MKRKLFIILGILVSLVIAFGMPKCGGEAKDDAGKQSPNTNISYSIGD